MPKLAELSLSSAAATPDDGSSYTLAQPENVLYGACLQCNTQCTIKAKSQDGVLVKLDGNPYGPQTMLPQIAYDTPVAQAAPVDGKLCPKGQAIVQTVYDPYRIRKVLKRAGPRGSSQWQTIPFAPAIAEIVQGGKLFAGIGEDRVVSGLNDVFVVKDAKTMKALADLQVKHRAELDLLIDPGHPDLGPKNNQFVFLAGRIEPGRADYSKRWVINAFGSNNWYDHTTICEQSHHIAYSQMTSQFADGAWTTGPNHKEPTWTNASWLIKLDDQGGPGKFLRAADVGLAAPAGQDPTNLFIVSKGGQLLAVNPNDDKQPVEGDLLVDTTANGVRAKTAFQLLAEEAAKKSLDEFATIAGVSVNQIQDLARELTNHGKKAGVEFYRGPVQHTNGYSTAQALITLNLLIGNVDWKGGLNAGGGSWAATGGKDGQPFDLSKQHNGKLAAFGVKVTRERVKYEATTLFKGYPAPRPFYPFTASVYQEVIPAIDAQYLYPIKVLWLHMGTPALSTPAGVPTYRPIQNSDGTPVEDNEYPFYLVTHKEITGGQSRTIGNYSSQGAVLPENRVRMNPRDLELLALDKGTKTTCLTDPIGGSASFYDTRVKVLKV